MAAELISGIIGMFRDATTFKTTILFLGIDGAGKTTLIEKLRCFANPERTEQKALPTTGFNTCKIVDKKYVITLWDVGGSDSFRGIWNQYIKTATAIVYVVNGFQPDRLQETRKIFDTLILENQIPIFLVFLNCTNDVLDLFPTSDQATVFFIDVNNSEDVKKLYDQIIITAKT